MCVTTSNRLQDHLRGQLQDCKRGGFIYVEQCFLILVLEYNHPTHFGLLPPLTQSVQSSSSLLNKLGEFGSVKPPKCGTPEPGLRNTAAENNTIRASVHNREKNGFADCFVCVRGLHHLGLE